MSSSSSRTSPGHDFEKAAEPVPEQLAREIDAADWEPLHDHDELNFDPPRRVYDPEQVLQPTPFGTLEVEVQRQLDPAAQRAIHEAQQRDVELEDDLQRQIVDLDDRDVQVAIQDDFERRLAERFRHAHELEQELER